MGFLGFKKDKTAYYTKRLRGKLDGVFKALSSEIIGASANFLPPHATDLPKLRQIVEERLSAVPALIALENGGRRQEQRLLSEILALSLSNAHLADETDCYTTPTAVYFYAEQPAMKEHLALWRRNPIIEAIADSRTNTVSQERISERNLGYFVQFVLCNYHEALFTGIRANEFVTHLRTFELIQLWRNKLRLLVQLFNQSPPPYLQTLKESLKTLESATDAIGSSLIEEEFWITKRDAYAALVTRCQSVVSNTEAAMLDWKERAEQGDVESVQRYRLAAEHGDVDAQMRLGDMYSQGRGVDQDDAEAIRWYRLAAEQGDAGAQDKLGDMYSYGRGVTQNHVEALRWYRLAAEQGIVRAQNRLGVEYELGRGVELDYVKAYMWYSLAAATGNSLARDECDRIANLLTPQELQEAQALATRCFESGYKDCD